ncbi:hypothetical protein J4212_07065 [Candidatus Woesearchaeota archaeon]|nr:hypothetical protein [Candidatus Woesearchaeota archaeon]
MASALSIILFFVYCYGFGSIARLAKESEDFLERHIMRIGIGLAAMPAFGLLLNLLHIPLDWRIFLLFSIALIAFSIYIDLKNKKPVLGGLQVRLNLYTIIALVLLAATFYMYLSGSFAYPYLEDDDPWSHSIGTSFIAQEKTLFSGGGIKFHYLDPYPPTYEMTMGILHQTNDSVYWNLKFFNSLIISLGIIFFFYFAKEFMKSSRKAAFAAFALFAVPAYLSHFIWALGFTMTLYFVSFYAAERIREDNKWWSIAAIVILTTITSSPTHSTYFGLFFLLYFFTRTAVERRFLKYEFMAGALAVFLAFALWWAPMIYTHGLAETMRGVHIQSGANVLSLGGTGDRPYALQDFLCSPKSGCYNGSNMINNPVGIGIFLFPLAVFGLILLISGYKSFFNKENYNKAVMIIWFLFAFYAVNAVRFKIKLSPFRAWMLLAFVTALAAAEAFDYIRAFVKSAAKAFTKNENIAKIFSYGIILLLAFAIYQTSFIPKYKVNTAQWSPGGFWTSGEEVGAYVWMRENLPKQSNVFTFDNFGALIGMDMEACAWCDEISSYRAIGFNQSAEENHAWLKENGFQYLIIDGQTAKKFGTENTNNKLNDIAESGLFSPVTQNNGAVILKV